MIELEVADGIALTPAQRQLISDAANTALRMEGHMGDIGVLITDAGRIQQLNRDFRNMDAVTDVLSFEAGADVQQAMHRDYLGDIAICMERAQQQAMDYGHSLERELGFLAIHGTLHLIGYDHVQPDMEADMMQAQNRILQEMRLARECG